VPLVEVSRSRASRTCWAASRRLAGETAAGEESSRGSLVVAGIAIRGRYSATKVAEIP
jgi:hypothetical protein